MKLIIIDHEGAICEPSRGLDWSVQGFRPMPGAAEAISRFNHAGYRVALVQDCTALQRGSCDMDQMNRLHANLIEALGTEGAHVDVMLFAQNLSTASRDCGLTEAIEDLMHRLRATPAQTTFVSVSNEHLACALRAGCRAVRLISTLQGALPPLGLESDLPADALVRVDLGAVARELAH